MIDKRNAFLGGIHDLAAFEREFGLPRGYIDELINTDDWNLILKSQTLLESASSLALALHLGKPELRSVFSHLPIGNRKYGKFAFLKTMALLTESELKFIELLCELRNSTAHNAVHLSFSLRNHISELAEGDKKSFIRRLNLRLLSIGIDGVTYDGDEAVLHAPNHALWSSLTQCLGKLYFHCITGKKRIEFFASKIDEHKATFGPIYLTPEIDDL